MVVAARVILVVLFGLLARAGAAQELATYDGCVDADGRAVPAILDPALAVAVATRGDGAAAFIVYNPQVLPRLGSTARLFLFAQECARHRLGLGAREAPTVDDARRADCEGVAMLRRSGLVDEGALDRIEVDLRLSADEWRYVPGPPRLFALRTCTARPSPTTGPQWNACVRACGEPLLDCRRSCRGDGCSTCEGRYEQCATLCDFGFAH